MIIEKLPRPIGPYQYKVIVPLRNTHTLLEVGEWGDNIGLACIITPRFSYFLTEQDALLFVIKWSQ